MEFECVVEFWGMRFSSPVWLKSSKPLQILIVGIMCSWRLSLEACPGGGGHKGSKGLFMLGVGLRVGMNSKNLVQ